MKYSVAKFGPLVYLVMCLLYWARLDILFYNPFPLAINLVVFATAIFLLMVESKRIDKKPAKQILLLHLLFSYIIAYSFNSALIGTMDRIADGSYLDESYRMACYIFILPSGIMLLFICGNYADRIRRRHTPKAKKGSKTKKKAVSPVFEK